MRKSRDKNAEASTKRENQKIRPDEAAAMDECVGICTSRCSGLRTIPDGASLDVDDIDDGGCGDVTSESQAIYPV